MCGYVKVMICPAKLGSVGRQAYNVDVGLFAPDGRPVGPGELGEIGSLRESAPRLAFCLAGLFGAFGRRRGLQLPFVGDRARVGVEHQLCPFGDDQALAGTGRENHEAISFAG